MLTDRRLLMYVLGLAALLVLGVMFIALPNLRDQTRSANLSRFDLDATVDWRLTRIALDKDKDRSATRLAEAGTQRAATEQAALDSTALAQQQAALTATAAPQLTQLAGIAAEATGTFNALDLQTRAAATQARADLVATVQARTATLSAVGTVITDINQQRTATAVALAEQARQREDDIARADVLSVANAAQIRKLADLPHSGPVEDLIISPDARLIAGANENRVRIWDLQTGKQVAEVTHSVAVNDLTFSPDSKLLAAATADGTIWLWDTATGNARAMLRAHQDTVFRVVFSPDGSMLASAGADKAVIWETATGRALISLPSGWAWNVAFSPAGRYVITAGGDGTVRIWGVPVP